MARPLRIEFAGALYHVISRGNERKPVVRDDADREKRLDWLRRTVETYGWRLYAFALLGTENGPSLILAADSCDGRLSSTT